MVFDRKSRSSWRVILSAIGLTGIVAGALGYWLYPERPKLTADTAYQETLSHYKAGGSRCEPATIGRFKGLEREEREDRCAEAKEQHRQQANGIVEERRSADAANASAIATYEQARVAAIEAPLGLITMVAAILAAIYAKGAAFQARRANNITKAALAHARLASAIELRPWMKIGIAECEIIPHDDGGNLLLTVVFENTGAAIAQGCVSNTEVLLVGSDFQTDEVDRRFSKWRSEKFRDPISLIPGDRFEVRRTVITRTAMMDWNERGLAGCVALAQVRYETPSGETCFSEQSFTLGHPTDLPLIRDGYLVRPMFEKCETPIVRKFRSGLCT